MRSSRARQKLADDHENAKFLAQGLAQIPGFKIDPAKVQTNIVICDITATGMTSGEISCSLAGRKVLASGVGPDLLRFVTHLDVNHEQCARALEVITSVLGAKVAPSSQS